MKNPSIQTIATERRPAFARSLAFRLHRKVRLLSQEELARGAGFSQPVLSRIESGARVATIEEQIRLAMVLDAKVSEIFEAVS